MLVSTYVAFGVDFEKSSFGYTEGGSGSHSSVILI